MKKLIGRFSKAHTIHFKDHKFDAATTVEEIKELVGTGFANADKMQSILILRRPKRFAGFSQEYYYVAVRAIMLQFKYRKCD